MGIFEAIKKALEVVGVLRKSDFDAKLNETISKINETITKLEALIAKIDEKIPKPFNLFPDGTIAISSRP